MIGYALAVQIIGEDAAVLNHAWHIVHPHCDLVACPACRFLFEEGAGHDDNGIDRDEQPPHFITRLLAAGDVIESEVAGIGVLTHAVVDEPAP